MLSDSAFNDARLVWQDGDPITQFDPHHPSTQYVRPGVSTEGESRYAQLTNREEQLADTVSLALGDHFSSSAATMSHSRSGGNGQEFGSPFVLGQFTFMPGISPSIPTSQLTINDVQRFTQGFGNVHYSVDENLWSLFAQDDYRAAQQPGAQPRPALRPAEPDRRHQQRLAAARLRLEPGERSRKTTVRGGYGIYYSEIQSNIDASWALAGPTGFFNFGVGAGAARLPDLARRRCRPSRRAPCCRRATSPSARARRAITTSFSTSRSSPAIPTASINPRTTQATLGAEQEIGAHWFLSVDGVHADRPPTSCATSTSTRRRSSPATPRGRSVRGRVADATRPITPDPQRLPPHPGDGERRRGKYDGLQLNLRKDFSTRGGHCC